MQLKEHFLNKLVNTCPCFTIDSNKLVEDITFNKVCDNHCNNKILLQLLADTDIPNKTDFVVSLIKTGKYSRAELLDVITYVYKVQQSTAMVIFNTAVSWLKNKGLRVETNDSGKKYLIVY